MPKEMKYEEAVRQLEEIVAKMESNELDVDSLSQQLKTAQKLIKLCKDKLSRADSDIKKILQDMPAGRRQNSIKMTFLINYVIKIAD